MKTCKKQFWHGFFHIRDDYKCLVQKQISLLKICNVLCKDLDEDREENSNIERNYIEIDI